MESQGKRRLGVGAGLVAGGALVGAVLAGTLSAGAATTPTAPSATSSTSSGPGVQENDGIAESQEHHGGRALDLAGTVTAVGTSTVTIKPASGTAITYTVTSSSDIDKNGEAQLSSLAIGDAVRYSINTGSTTIDKLHAGDEAKDRPTGDAAPGGSSG